MTKPVRIRASQLKPLTKAEVSRLNVLAQKHGSPAHDPDNPALSAEQLARLRRRRGRPPRTAAGTTTVTMRIDSDVLAWLRAKGPGYQTRVNAILRRAMSRPKQQGKT